MDQVPGKLRILLVEDQRSLAENVWEFLELRGHIMDHAADGQAGLQLATDHAYDVVVLDIGLPRIDGIEVCRRFRAQGGTTPILMLTARDRLEDKLLGFESGADDYMTKPFAIRELEARIQALYLRGQRRSPSVLRVGELALDTSARRATRADVPLQVSPSGYRLLEALMRKSPHVLLAGELGQALWGDAEHDPARLHNHVSALRGAVDRPFDRPMIITVHGFGYRLVTPAAS